MNIFKSIRLSKFKSLLLFKRNIFNESSFEYKHNLNELLLYGFDNRMKFAEIHDIKISPTDWEKVIMKWSDGKNNSQNLKRIPKLMITKILLNNKLELLDSFLYYVINEKTFHDPFIIMSILQITVINNTYLHQYIDKYEEIATDKVFEHLFTEYLFVLLSSPYHREKGFDILEKRQRDVKYLSAVIKTSPATESWNRIVKYVTELMQCSQNWCYDIEKKIFEKIIDNSSTLTLKAILETIHENDLCLEMDTIKLIEQQFKNVSGFQLKFNKTNGLHCCCCGTNLKEAVIPTEYCNDLAQFFMNNVMNIDSIEKLYQNCHPKEMERFKFFYKTCKLPFDCVIDLPNFSINSNLHRGISFENSYRNLLKSFETLFREKRGLNRICIIGKESSYFTENQFLHLQKLLRPLSMKYNAEFFFFNSRSNRKDDLLMLYLALKSGPDCYICSADEFRDHKARINDSKMRSFFTKWQMARQIVIKTGQKDLFHSHFYVPNSASVSIQYDDNKHTWHLPYTDSQNQKLFLHGLVNWACLKLS